MVADREPWTLTARWVFPVSGPPLEQGTVTVQGERIVAIEPRDRHSADVDLGNAALLPGLVNAHAHLDLSGARGQTPPTPDFTTWLRQVIAFRQARTPAQVQADIQAGLDECQRCGTTLIGDIGAEGASWDAAGEVPLRAVVFRELLGLTQDRAATELRRAMDWQVLRAPTLTCRPGLSPHAPYSFRAELLPAVAAQTDTIAMHLAETRAEGELLARHSGPFVAFLAERGVWDPYGLPRSPEQVIELTRAGKRILYVHGNYLRPAAPIPAHGTVVYCPRTHAAFGHPPHPFREFLRRGVRIALGTDSLASNPDLDLLAEVRFVHQRHPDVPGAVLLRMATLSGAEALGWQEETGSLEPGKSADLVVLPLPDEESADPHRLVLESALPVRSVLYRGSWIQGAT